MGVTRVHAAGTDLEARISAQLAEARARTLGLLEAVPKADETTQHSPLMSPLVWDLAHIGHYEELWLLRNLVGAPPTDLHFDDVYDAFRHPRHERPSLRILDPREARAFAADVRARVLETLAKIELDRSDPLRADGFVYGMVVQHEHQHDETMLATLNLRDAPYPRQEEPAPAGDPDIRGEILVRGGPFTMGTDDEPWAYDNERPARTVELAPFWIDAAPTPNEAYLEFIEAGAYHEPRWWSAAGWAWRHEAGLEHPELWARDDATGRWRRRRFGVWEPVPLDEPVQHVCWYEADAYARWRGKRLPTEAEWEKAASWDAAAELKRRYPWGEAPPTRARANLWPGRFGPDPIGAHPEGASPWACQQMLGDVWEWTSTDFAGYPGFRAFPYREYSEVFFGPEYKVLRGGSWATHPAAIRTTFRNWDFPIRRQIFAGFRCARDA